MPSRSSKDRQLEKLSSDLGRLWAEARDRERIAEVVARLDAKYDLGAKLAKEDGVGGVIEQMVERLARAYRTLSSVRGQRILDIACGSNTSRAPASLSMRPPFGKRKLGHTTKGFTALFEPWFCRMLVELGADAVGVDFGDLEGEAFEHYGVDLGEIGALGFLPGRSFDGIQDSRLFGSPEFTAQFPKLSDRLKVAAEIRQQEERVLKPGGVMIHSDARALLNG